VVDDKKHSYRTFKCLLISRDNTCLWIFNSQRDIKDLRSTFLHSSTLNFRIIKCLTVAYIRSTFYNYIIVTVSNNALFAYTDFSDDYRLTYSDSDLIVSWPLRFGVSNERERAVRYKYLSKTVPLINSVLRRAREY